MRNYLRQYLSMLDASTRKKLIVLVLLFFISSMLDVLGIGMVGVFATVVVNASILFKYLPALLAQRLHVLTNFELISLLGGVIILTFILKGILACWVQYKLVKTSYRQMIKIQCDLLRYYQCMPYEQFMQRNTSDMVSVLQKNVSIYINSTLISSLRFVSALLMLSAVMALLVITHPIPLLVMMSFFAALFLVYDLVMKRRLMAAGETVNTAYRTMFKCIRHALTGFKEVRILGVGAYFYDQAKSNADQFAQATSLTNMQQFIPRYMIEAVMIVFVIGLFIAYTFATGQAISALPVLSLFSIAGVRLMPVISQLLQCSSQLRFSIPILADLSTLYASARQTQAQFKTTSSALAFNDVIQLQSISFHYGNAPAPSLRSVSLEIHRGESVGVMGTSGAGKTTLVDVISGLITPQSGAMYIDGVCLTEDNRRDWQNHIAYIPQDIFIVDDTLARNIALGADEIDMARLQQSIAIAQLSEVVQGLERGMNTLLGENGVRLSGGQRQRVALARAFYYSRDIIIMDEATSALDQETEREVVNAIHHLKGKSTLIVIAHRASTIAHCDRVFRLEKGELVGVGNNGILKEKPCHT